MKNNEINARAKKAAKLFLERRDMEIVEVEPDYPGVDFIALEDDDILAFIRLDVETDSDRGFPSEANDRNQFEAAAIAYLTEHPTEDIRVRFDTLALVLVGESKGLIRFHRNALGVV